MGLNDEPNTTETQTVSSDEQFSGLGGRRVMGAGRKLVLPEKKPIQFMMRFIISQR